MEHETYHKSVLREEVLEALSVMPGEVYLDCTFGGGGHSEGILGFAGQIVAIDTDIDAVQNATEKFGLKEQDGVWVTDSGNLKIYQANFKDLDSVAKKAEVAEFSGILFDLGVSSFMFDKAEKGFSFSKEGPLDMRMDQNLAVKAADLVNGLNEGELYELFTKLGQESYGRSIARDIVRSRVIQPIKTTSDLTAIIKRNVRSQKGINPSTKVFMALRIAVNDELNNLREALPKATDYLKKGGRIVVLSFHSLEDKIVKEFFKQEARLKIINPKPIAPGLNEISENPRARSVKMRIAEKM